MNDIELIPLGKLRLSDANVRKNDSNLFIEELAANIEAKGLLQNLIVVPAKKRGMFDVTAGGRRLRALGYLLEAGKLPKDYPVACRVLDIDAAEQSELSLIENVIRLDMTPTDEIRAYKHFVNEGSDLDAIAKRFGRTRRFIEGRLRLADLADPIFAALEEGKITLDVAKAYATTPMPLDPPQGFAQDCNGDVFGDERYDALGRPGVAGGLIGRFQRQRIDQWRIFQLFSLTIEVFDYEQIVRDCGS